MGLTADEFAFPDSWFVDEVTESGKHPSLRLEIRDKLPGDIVFSDLSDTGQTRFLGNGVAVYATKLPTEAEEYELLLTVNFGGVPHER